MNSPLLTTLAIVSAILLILSVFSFLISVSRKNMSLIYVALILFLACVGLSAYTLYRFIWYKVEAVG